MKTNISDILNCLANLSSDEVFTAPELANKMLDLLPQELFSNPDTKFLDPCSKSGVFLREIAKRLLIGLETQIPDLQERINHIMSKQLFGIALTQLTAEMSRRTLYCAKKANGDYSVSTCFKNEQGNLRYMRCQHVWQNGKCSHCGANRAQYDRGDTAENYAYPFIHKPLNEIFKDMQFDVIIGNPPYQMSFGIDGGNSSNAKSIYNLFIEQALKLNPNYLCMITPSRWMTKTSQGIPEEWVDKMLTSNHFVELHDHPDSNDCFSSLAQPIKGGVSYFLWNNQYLGKCKYYYHYSNSNDVLFRFDYLDSAGAGIVIRDPKSYSIIERIAKVEKQYYKDDDKNFSSLVSPKHFFDNSELLTSNWKEYKLEKDDIHCLKYYVSKTFNGIPFGWISLSQLPKNQATLPLHKVFIPAAGGSGTDDKILGEPFYGEPNSVCSQTYLVIGYNPEKHHFTEEECKNIITYIKTRFFRYLVSVKKKTQNGPRGVYQFVPLQDFSHPWTDEMLYKKYKLTEEEIGFIESMIKPME